MADDNIRPIFTIDVQVRFRGSVYNVDLTRVLKWLLPLIVVATKGILLLHRSGL